MSDITTIQVPASGGSVVVKTSVPHFPQSVAGVVWRYNADKTPDGKAGIFSTNIPDVPLGAPMAIDKKLFLIEGAVLHHNDNPPTPYQVVVAITQGGSLIHEEVPSIGGAGQIRDKNIPFLYRFTIVVV